MAYDTTFTIIQNPVGGATLNFVDTTVISVYSDVKATRFVFGSYPVSNNPQTFTSGYEMEIYRQYKSLTLQGFTYDSILIPIGGTFIPLISGVLVQTDSQMQETGNYSQVTSFLPTANYTPRIITPAILGVEAEGNGSIPDGVYLLTYEQYIDNSPSIPTSLGQNVQYMVYGAGATATYNGNTYREGAVFISQPTVEAISFTGGGTVKVLNGLRFSYFACTYNIERGLVELQYWMYRNCIQDEKLDYRIAVMYTNLRSVQFSVIQNYTSAALDQEKINSMLNELAYIQTEYNVC